MASARVIDPDDGWDWWGLMEWPPRWREFDAGEWPAATVPRSWRLFCEARREAAPFGWRLARARAMHQAEVLYTP